MATTTSRIPDVMDALQTGLAARAGLANVTVQSGPGDLKYLGLEYLALGVGRVSIPQSQRAAGNQFKQEAARIDCEIRSGVVGVGETAIRACRDRAFVILAEVEDFLRTTPNLSITAVDHLLLRDVDYGIGWDDRVTWCEIGFTIAGNISLIS